MAAIALKLRQTQIVYLSLLKSIKSNFFLYGSDPIPEKGTWLRHDEDWDIDYSMKLASLENRLGFRSTYFLNHTCDYFDFSPKLAEKLKQIVGLGHDLGIHVNFVEDYMKKGTCPSESMDKIMEFMTKFGLNFVGSSAHGSRQCTEAGLLNAEIWKEFDSSPLVHLKKTTKYSGKLPCKRMSLSDYSLKFEASFLDHKAYISDSSGRIWGMYKNENPAEQRVYDVMEYAQSQSLDWVTKNNINEVVDYFNLQVKQGFLQILVHPKWWIPNNQV